MDPINYSVQVANPFQQSLQGVETGLNIAGALQKQRLVEAQGDVEKQRLADMQAAAKANVAFQADLGKLSQDPSPNNIITMMARYPTMADHFAKVNNAVQGEQQQARISSAQQVYSALQAEQPDVAVDLLNQQAAAYRESKREDEARGAETMAKLIKLNPKAAMASTGAYLASAMGPDKFAETFNQLAANRRADELQPAELSAKKSAAIQAAAKAKFAEADAALDIEKKGWDIWKIAEDADVARINARIAAGRLAVEQADSKTRRDELSLQVKKFELERDNTLRTKVADATAARTSIDNFLNTADQVLATPADVRASAHGPLAARLPTVSQGVADYEALIQTLGSQAFISQIPAMKGTGALSEREGDKLQASIQNIGDLKQSPAQHAAAVKEAQRLMLKARANLNNRYGIPDTLPDTPRAGTGASGAADIEALLKKYGATPSLPLTHN